jgi:hypothetical protein
VLKRFAAVDLVQHFYVSKDYRPTNLSGHSKVPVLRPRGSDPCGPNSRPTIAKPNGNGLRWIKFVTPV